MSTGGYCARSLESAFSALRAHADAWAETAEPPETFFRRDIPECGRAAFDKLLRTAAVEKVREVPRHEIYDVPQTSNVAYEYRWHERAWAAIQRQVKQRDAICPCGHSGLQNHGDHYTCSYEDCDRRFDRDELEVDG